MTLGGGPHPPAEIWYLLHGYGQLAHRFVRRFLSFADDDRLLVAPEGLSRFYPARRGEGPARRAIPGASWMTSEDREREIADYVRYLDTVASLTESGGLSGEEADTGRAAAREGRAPLRTLLGFSQGVHTAARWAALGHPRFERLIFWGAALPPDLPPEAPNRLRRSDIVLIRGETDELRRPGEEEREEEWLRSEGLPYRIVTHPGGHEIDREVLAELVRD